MPGGMGEDRSTPAVDHEPDSWDELMRHKLDLEVKMRSMTQELKKAENSLRAIELQAKDDKSKDEAELKKRDRTAKRESYATTTMWKTAPEGGRGWSLTDELSGSRVPTPTIERFSPTPTRIPFSSTPGGQHSPTPQPIDERRPHHPMTGVQLTMPRVPNHGPKSQERLHNAGLMADEDYHRYLQDEHERIQQEIDRVELGKRAMAKQRPAGTTIRSYQNAVAGPSGVKRGKTPPCHPGDRSNQPSSGNGGSGDGGRPPGPPGNGGGPPGPSGNDGGPLGPPGGGGGNFDDGDNQDSDEDSDELIKKESSKQSSRPRTVALDVPTRSSRVPYSNMNSLRGTPMHPYLSRRTPTERPTPSTTFIPTGKPEVAVDDSEQVADLFAGLSHQ
ncbi:hypothetical protein BXZ70DRAFT_1013308 [Cristinia sonorae]|uniref:Uncharacterized protein n=1 Tax=Cristinia sonorae TaxID=1940300 RepID=A0A8K0XJC9_9AGAR|nr:hypothetical protein BXZ70DRAFT_1013308 [Cristinia sonorae]